MTNSGRVRSPFAGGSVVNLCENDGGCCVITCWLFNDLIWSKTPPSGTIFCAVFIQHHEHLYTLYAALFSFAPDRIIYLS